MFRFAVSIIERLICDFFVCVFEGLNVRRTKIIYFERFITNPVAQSSYMYILIYYIVCGSNTSFDNA